MAYTRFSFADVYVYMDVTGVLRCCGCSLSDEWDYDSTEAMITHLEEHRAAGHGFPEETIAELRADDAENFPPQCREGHAWGAPYTPFPDVPQIQRARCTRCEWERYG